MEKQKLINNNGEIGKYTNGMQIGKYTNGMQIDEKWKENRKVSFVIFFFSLSMNGIEFVLMQSTLLPYLTSELHVSRPAFFYGIISASRFLIVLVCGIYISRWFDKRRKLRYALLSLKTIGIIGYFVYVIPISPWLPAAGALLQGATYTCEMLMYAEVLRVYETEDIQGKLLCMVIAWASGEAVGSVLLPLLGKVDFWFAGIHVVYGNIASFILICLGIINMALFYFFLHDISQEFDLKAYRTRMEHRQSIEKRKEASNLFLHGMPNDVNAQTYTEQQIQPVGTIEGSPEHFLHNKSNTFESKACTTTVEYMQPEESIEESPKRCVQDISNESEIRSYRVRLGDIRDLGTLEETPTSQHTPSLYEVISSLGCDAVLLLLQQFYTAISITLLTRLIPVIMQSLHYSSITISLAFLVDSVLTITLSFIINKMNLSSVGVYYSGLLSLVILLVNYIALLLLRQGAGDAVNYTLISIFIASLAFSWIGDHTFIVGTLGKLFPSSIQTFIEYIRLTIHCVGSLLGAFSCMHVYFHITYVFPGIVIATILLFIVVVLRRDTLRYPEIIRDFYDASS